ncbi:hypothetical protein HN51_040268, partial [Arachis hypogaea]
MNGGRGDRGASQFVKLSLDLLLLRRLPRWVLPLHSESGFDADPVGLAEEIWKASERESLEASIEAAFEAIRSRRTESYVVPSHCVPIVYKVDRLRDGKSFATWRVDAIQKKNIVFTLLASFQ